jgi:hypothetical protein
MNTKQAFVAAVIAFSAAAAFVSSARGAPRSASPTVAASVCGPAPSFVQRQVLKKSAQGPAALRGYVYITRGTHQLDLAEADAWAAKFRAQQAACAAGAA